MITGTVYGNPNNPTAAGSIEIIHGDTYIMVYEVEFGQYSSKNFSINRDIQINEGEYVGFRIISSSAGVATSPRFEISNAGVFTSSNQGILAYLGDYGTTTKTGGGVR
jgi:hypothetical protein